MTTISTTKQEVDIDTLLARVNKSGKPLKICGMDNTGILITDFEWRSIQATLYLKSVPGLWDSIVESSNAPRSEFVDADSVSWDV